MSKQPIPYFPLKTGRAHEVCGAGRYFFAFMAGQSVKGPVLWVRETWRTEQLNPMGFGEFLEPSNLLLAQAQDQQEALAVTEEGLRAGAVPLVVTELSKPIGLTEGRRLQLAARDGNSTALAVIPEGMGSHAAETRWHAEPVFDPADSTHQKWELIKNKSGTLGVWHVRWSVAAHRLLMVSPPGC
ncbi:MAG: hypothetical protein OIF40_17090 [Mangrovicoccus sp.]|nr:hypothetical protein [Mangrovicoccus sp.]